MVAASYSHFRRTQPNVKGRISVEMIDGIKYVWILTPKYTAASNFGRVLSMMLFTIQCLYMKLPLSTDYDIVMASSPHPFSIYPAKKIASRFNARLIYDIRDLWPMTLVLLGGLSVRHPFIRLMQAAEDYACINSDLVIAVQRHAKEYLMSRGLEERKFLHVANGAILDFSTPDQLPSTHLMTLKK